LIYRREYPSSPSKRFRTTILNPAGSPNTHKAFYKSHQKTSGQHAGTKVCLRRKKNKHKNKFNLYYGMQNCKSSVISEISLHRRYKTFVGLIIYSNGSMGCAPMFSGAFVGTIINVVPYAKNPKIHFFERFRTGSYVPISYLYIMNCFFNITYSYKKFS